MPRLRVGVRDVARAGREGAGWTVAEVPAVLGRAHGVDHDGAERERLADERWVAGRYFGAESGRRPREPHEGEQERGKERRRSHDYWVVKVALKSWASALPTRSVTPPFGSTISYVVLGFKSSSGSKLTTPQPRPHLPARG